MSISYSEIFASEVHINVIGCVLKMAPSSGDISRSVGASITAVAKSITTGVAVGLGCARVMATALKDVGVAVGVGGARVMAIAPNVVGVAVFINVKVRAAE